MGESGREEGLLNLRKKTLLLHNSACIADRKRRSLYKTNGQIAFFFTSLESSQLIYRFIKGYLDEQQSIRRCLTFICQTVRPAPLENKGKQQHGITYNRVIRITARPIHTYTNLTEQTDEQSSNKHNQEKSHTLGK